MLANKLQARTYYDIAFKANSYHVNFYLRVLSRFDSNFDVDNPAPQFITSQLACFRTAVTAEDDFFKRVERSDLTPLIEEADTRRDNNTSSLRAMANAFAMNPGDAQKQADGQRVLDLMKHYQLNINDNYENQGSKTLQFCQAIDANPQYSAAVASIGATPFYTALKQANDDCRRLIDQRNSERAQQPQQKMVDLRKATDQEYRDLIMILNAYVLVDTDPDSMAWLVNTLNVDVNYYEKTVFAGQKDGSQDGGDEPVPTPTPTPDGGGSSDGGGDQGGGGSDDQGGGGSDPTPTPTPDPSDGGDLDES